MALFQLSPTDPSLFIVFLFKPQFTSDELLLVICLVRSFMLLGFLPSSAQAPAPAGLSWLYSNVIRPPPPTPPPPPARESFFLSLHQFSSKQYSTANSLTLN